MLMTFSKERYMHRINSGVKIHTIRADKHNRWKVGMTAHMWMHSPRNVKKNPFQFGHSIISEIKEIEIVKTEPAAKTTWMVFIEGQQLHGGQIESLARSDGFDTGWEFLDWFGEFNGRLIFWKDYRRIK